MNISTIVCWVVKFFHGLNKIGYSFTYKSTTWQTIISTHNFQLLKFNMTLILQGQLFFKFHLKSRRYFSNSEPDQLQKPSIFSMKGERKEIIPIKKRILMLKQLKIVLLIFQHQDLDTLSKYPIPE